MNLNDSYCLKAWSFKITLGVLEVPRFWFPFEMAATLKMRIVDWLAYREKGKEQYSEEKEASLNIYLVCLMSY